MKNLIKFKTSCLATTAIIGCLAASVHAQVISWNVDSYSTISGASQYAGVISAPWWNNTYQPANNGNYNAVGASVSWYNLFDSTGANSGVSVTGTTFADGWWNYWSILGSGVVPDADGTYNNVLLNGYDNEADNNITISSIPYGQYDLYVYFTADASPGRAGTVTVGSTTYDFTTMGSTANSGANAVFTQTTDTTGANPTADYAVFTGLTGGSQTIAAAVTGWGGIAGFQIVAVPEPATLALVAVGGVGFLLLGRRSKSKANP